MEPKLKQLHFGAQVAVCVCVCIVYVSVAFNLGHLAALCQCRRLLIDFCHFNDVNCVMWPWPCTPTGGKHTAALPSWSTRFSHTNQSRQLHSLKCTLPIHMWDMSVLFT